MSRELKKILETLSNQYSYNLNVENLSTDDLIDLQERVVRLKENFMLTESFNSYFSSPEYTKLYLIESAIKVILREIAPKRLTKRTSAKRSK